MSYGNIVRKLCLWNGPLVMNIQKEDNINVVKASWQHESKLAKIKRSSTNCYKKYYMIGLIINTNFIRFWVKYTLLLSLVKLFVHSKFCLSTRPSAENVNQ